MASFAHSGAQWVSIGTNTAYTQNADTTVIFRVDISSYFSANGLDANSPNLPFPDNAVVQANGLDPGNCVQQILPFGTICSNYRFKCEALLPASTFSNTAATFELIDLNALYLHKPDDPPGTCYLSPYQNANGQGVLGISAIVTDELSLGVADRVGTMGWFAVLGGGVKALQPGNYITFAVVYNPRPTDPQTFAWGDGTTTLQNNFQTIAVGNAYEPVQVTGVNCGVFETGTQLGRMR